MAFEPLVITAAGQALLARALQGDTLTFTSAQMGDGTITTQTVGQMTALVHPVISLGIASINCADNTATIVSNFSNIVTDTFTGDGSTKNFALSAYPAALTAVTVGGTTVTDYAYTASSGQIVFQTAPTLGALIAVGYNMAAFSWREIGVFAADPDHPNDRAYDILYCYQNAGTEPYPIPAPDPTPYTEKITIKVYISQAQSVTITVASGLDAAGIAFDSTGIDGVTAETLQGAVEQLAEIAAGKADAETVTELTTQVTQLSTAVEGKAPAEHSHGNITADGKITVAATGATTGTGLEPVFAGTDNKLGKVTLAQARSMLKITPISTTTATLTASGWTTSDDTTTQTVNVTGVTATSVLLVSSAPANHTAWIEAGVYCSAQGAGTLTFTCTDTPEDSLTANIMIMEVAG